jgi:hypothetical protein
MPSEKIKKGATASHIEMSEFANMEINGLLTRLETNLFGLTDSEVKSRIKEFGFNKIA